LIKLMGQVVCEDSLSTLYVAHVCVQDVEDMGMFIYCLWTMVVCVLIRESKRLKRDGRDIGGLSEESHVSQRLTVQTPRSSMLTSMRCCLCCERRTRVTGWRE
jgi:hypothetical protein